MGFRNPITALSELVADKLVGALIKTAETGARIELYQALGLGHIDFISAPAAAAPASIQAGTGGVSQDPVLFVYGPTKAGHQALFYLMSTANGSQAWLTADSVYLDTPGGLCINNTGFVAGADFGRYTGTTDASGILTVPHNMGALPTMAIASPASHFGQALSYHWDRGASSATNLKFYCRKNDNTAYAGITVTVAWLAMS